MTTICLAWWLKAKASDCKVPIPSEPIVGTSLKKFTHRRKAMSTGE